jgi:Fe-S-cluster-containing hydrogenase component 2
LLGDFRTFLVSNLFSSSMCVSACYYSHLLSGLILLKNEIIIAKHSCYGLYYCLLVCKFEEGMGNFVVVAKKSERLA